MPVYQYKSKDGQIIEIFRSMKQKIPEKISRKKVLYYRVWTVPSVIVDSKKPKTLGSLAEANTKKMVKEGKIPKKQKPPKPWWRDKEKPDLSLASMTKKQKLNYIKTGRKNG